MKSFSHIFLIVIIFAAVLPSVSFASCNSDAQCPPDMRCDMSMGTWGVCEPKPNLQKPECTGDYDCSANTMCSYGEKQTGICLNGKCAATITYCPSSECADDKNCKIAEENKELSGQVYYESCNVLGGRKTGGQSVAVDNIKLKFEYTDSEGNKHSDPNDFVWTDSNSKFTFSSNTMFAAGNKIDILICFEDKYNKLFLVKQDNLKDAICLPALTGLDASDPTLKILQIDITPKSKKPSNTEEAIDNYVRIYSDIQKAISFKENMFKQYSSAKERVIVEWDGYAWAAKLGKQAFLPATDSHLSEAFTDGTWNDGPTGLRVGKGYIACYLDTPDTQFHEYCHHIQSEFGPEEILPTRLPTGENHGGYFTNNNTEWGMIEAWAEFCSSEMNKYYGTAPYGFIAVGRTSLVNIEADYPIRGKGFTITSEFVDFEQKKNLGLYNTKYQKDASANEEFAIAGIFLDLSDSPSDYNGVDDDHISLPLSEIYKAYSQKRNFADGYHHPYTLSEFYTAINAVTANNTQLHEEYIQGSKYTNLDQIFIRHLGFQDENNNTVWDLNESIGYTGRLDRVRSSPPYIPGTELVLSVADQNGNIASDLFATVTVTFDAPNERLSYSYDILVYNNSIYLPIVPESYNATISVTAFQSDTSNQASESFVITTKELYDRIDPSVPIGVYTSTITISESIIPTPDPGPTPNPCAVTFVLLPLLGLVLFRKN